MSEAAKILLGLIRYANRNDIDMNPVLPQLVMLLRITNGEMTEIGEVLKADIREINATYPGYEHIKDQLSRMGPSNPNGVKGEQA